MTRLGTYLQRSGWLLLIGAWVAALAALMIWIGGTAPHVLREQLKTLQFWSLELCFVAVGTCLLLVAREVIAVTTRGDRVRMLVLALMAIALTVFVAPRTNRIYYDEQIYQSIGHNMSDLRRAQMCLDGTVEYGRLECAAGEYNKQPYAYPHLLSVFYRVGGAGPGWAFVANAVAIGLTVIAVYLAVLLLFDDALSAFFAGLVMALTPHQILWSATAAVEPLASLACVSAVAAVAQFTRSRSTVALLAAAVTTVYAVQFRPESFLIVIVVALVLVARAPEEIKTARLWWVGLLCLGLLAVHFAHLFAVRNEGWGTDGPRFSLTYVVPNLSVNGWFYVRDERFPVLYTALALTGLAAARLVTLRLATLVYFAIFFLICLFFYAGSYNYGADVRYSVMTYPPIAMLAGLGAGQLVRRLEQMGVGPNARHVITAAVLFQFLWYAPVVRATTEEAWAARADVEFAERVAAVMPRNAYVLTHNPGIFHLLGVNAGQMFLAADNPGRMHYLSRRYSGGVFLHWNFWCNVADPVQQDLCRKVLSMAPGTVWHEHREQDQRFFFSRFSLGEVVAPTSSSGQIGR